MLVIGIFLLFSCIARACIEKMQRFLNNSCMQIKLWRLIERRQYDELSGLQKGPAIPRMKGNVTS